MACLFMPWRPLHPGPGGDISRLGRPGASRGAQRPVGLLNKKEKTPDKWPKTPTACTAAATTDNVASHNCLALAHPSLPPWLPGSARSCRDPIEGGTREAHLHLPRARVSPKVEAHLVLLDLLGNRDARAEESCSVPGNDLPSAICAAAAT